MTLPVVPLAAASGLGAARLLAAASEIGSAPMALAAFRTRYLVVAAVLLALLAVAVLVIVRRRQPALEVRRLDAAAARRYLETFAAVEREFEARPDVAVGQARGIVEEALRRMGFPDRVDAAQKARDLAAHDRRAGTALEGADRALREDADRESLRRALTGYREVLDRLLEDATDG
jgi:hypothetical protein